MSILELANEYNAEAIALRRNLHRNPELSGQEFETTALIRTELEKYGICILKTNLTTGLIAKIGLGRSEKTLMLRADIDALPMTEESGLSFASEQPGRCHSCGHDLHTAALLTCAKILKKAEAQIAGTILFVFQPAEENFGGAKSVCETGIFERYHPQMIVGLHTWPDLPAGTVGLKKGPFMAASDLLTITVTGKNGHAAHPHKAIDPIMVSGYLITALQTIVSRNVAPLDSAVITIGKMTAGTAANVIPERAVLEGSVRTADPEVQNAVEQRLRTLLPSIAEGFGAECTVDYIKGTPAVVNDTATVELLQRAAQQVLSPDQIVFLEKPSMGSEDFATYLQRIPGAIFRIGTSNEQLNSHCALHNAKIIFDEQAIMTGASVLSQFSQEFFKI
ncbi:MAG: M20 family metallopeptidase [Pygmaiobacter sp.]